MRELFLRTLLLTVFFSFHSAEACQNDPAAASVLSPVDTSQLTLVWRTPLDISGRESLSINPLLNGNGDVLMSCFSTRSKREPMMLFDGKTGKQKWKWDDYLRDEEGFFDQCHIVDQNTLFLCAHNATYALNILTGQTVWKHYMDTMYGSPFVFRDADGYIYHSFRGENGNYTSYIFRTPADQLRWELVCSISDTPGNTFSRRTIDNMVFTTNNAGEKLLIYQLWRANTSSDPNTAMACFNLDKRKYEWINNYTGRYNEWGHTNMIAEQGLIYTYASYGSERHLLAVKVSDGKIAWDNTLTEEGVGLYTFKGNILSTLNGAQPVTMYEGKTGRTIWQQSFSPALITRLNFATGDGSIFKHYFFSTQCNLLIILDLNKGNIVFGQQALPLGQCMEHGVAIDEKSRTFFVQDRVYVNCFKLPESVKY